MTMERGSAADNVPSVTMSPLTFMKLAIVLTVISALALSFVISFAALIYSGPLAEHLSMGVGLALIGSIAMPIFVAFRSSCSGVICHVQDVPTLLLAAAAASIGVSLSQSSPEQVFPTVATLVGVTSIFTGFSLFVAGRFRLGSIARFIPYSVIGGFLAATGLLLTIGALSMVLKDSISIGTLTSIFGSGRLTVWLPWLALSALLVFLTRKLASDITLPAVLLLAAITFYALLWLNDIDLDQAGEMDLLLGPFPSNSFFDGLSPSIPMDAHWGTIFSHAPTIVAVATVSAIGLLLNSSALEVALDQDIDFERELTTVGSSNVLAGLTGGLVGFHLLGETLFANKVGATGRAAGIAVGIAAAVPLVMGAQIVGAFPVGLAATVVAFLGLDLLYEWLWVQRRRLPWTDKLVIAFILVTAATLGFLEALAAGLLAASILFVISYASVDVVRVKTTNASRRSSVERGPTDMAYLADHGGGARIFELGGYLFFGTANSLLDAVKDEIAGASPPRAIVFDYSRVVGLDTSANFAMKRVADICEKHKVLFAISGTPDALAQKLSFAEKIGAPQNFASLDDALIALETDLLAGSGRRGFDTSAVRSLLDEVLAEHPEIDGAQFSSRLSLSAGDVLISERSQSTEVYQLLSGELRAEVSGQDGKPHVLARFLPGALVGEIAYYTNAPRTAAVIADTHANVLKIQLERIPDTREGRAVAAEFHRRAAGYLAQRLMRMTNLFRDAGL